MRIAQTELLPLGLPTTQVTGWFNPIPPQQLQAAADHWPAFLDQIDLQASGHPPPKREFIMARRSMSEWSEEELKNYFEATREVSLRIHASFLEIQEKEGRYWEHVSNIPRLQLRRITNPQREGGRFAL